MIDLNKEMVTLEVDPRNGQEQMRVYGCEIRKAINDEVKKQIEAREFELYKENLKLKDLLIPLDSFCGLPVEEAMEVINKYKYEKYR